MRTEHPGDGRIPKGMNCLQPRKPDESLNTETQDLFLYKESDYIHVVDQLKILNRKLIPVSQKNFFHTF